MNCSPPRAPLPARPADSVQGAEVEIIDETAEEFEDDGVKLIRRVLNESDPELSITDADIIVAGGRGMGSAENFGLIRELAGLIAAGVQTAKPFSRVLHLKLRKVWCKCLTRFEK